jgi:hypothetical protein
VQAILEEEPNLRGPDDRRQADPIVQLLEAAGPDLDPATFDAAANGGGYTEQPIEGGPGVMNTPAGHFLSTDCAAVVRIESGAYSVVEPFPWFESYTVG